jgi:hypothetical protein
MSSGGSGGGGGACNASSCPSSSCFLSTPCCKTSGGCGCSLFGLPCA